MKKKHIVRFYGGAEVLQMETDLSGKTVVKLFWRSGLTEQPWTIISRNWIDELRSPPWSIDLAIDPDTHPSEKYRILEETSKSYGHYLLRMKGVEV